jgi:hypothetical protein
MLISARTIFIVRMPGRTVLMLIVGVVVCGTAVGVMVSVRSSGHPVDTATVLAADVAVIGLAVTVLLPVGAWWNKGRVEKRAVSETSSQADAAADRLAVEMTDRWQQEAVRRRIITPVPVTVRWRWAADMASRQDVTTLRAPGAAPRPLPGSSNRGEVLGSGVVTRLHDELYARLPHGRLVVIGGPGAGKTGAMLLLMLAALDWRASQATEAERAQVPVPVWLTLGGWDPAATTLREWAAVKMNLDHPALRAPEYGADAAGVLLRNGRVALFLDGLDEMPQGARAQVLERISEEAGGLRVVLTSRPEEYQRTLESAALDNTAVVELLPVRPAAARSYLLHGQTGPRREQWAQVTDYLTGNPGSVVARALDNPLALSLARDAYTSRDPAELTDPAVFPTPASLLEHLMDQILVVVYPDERQRAHAARWLAWIARHMGTSRDLAWWDIPNWIPRWQLRLAGVLGFGFLAGITSALRNHRYHARPRGLARGQQHARSRRWACIRGGHRARRRTRLRTVARPQREATSTCDPLVRPASVPSADCDLALGCDWPSQFRLPGLGVLLAFPRIRDRSCRLAGVRSP